jgi:hypothetical protein
VKKKSKGEIIQELQNKNEEQQHRLQEMEMHHLEMFQRIMSLEAENKQLRAHMGAMRRAFQDPLHRVENAALPGVDAGMPASGPGGNGVPFPSHRFRGVVANVANQSLPPPPPMFDSMGNPYYQNGDSGRLSFTPIAEPPQDRDVNDPFHLD